MSLIRRMLGLDMDRVLTRDDVAGWTGNSGWVSTSGTRVSPETALTIAAVWSAVRLVSETTGMLPLHLYERLESGGRSDARNHPIERLISNRPNRWQTPMEFREMLQGHVELRGNGYAWVLRNRAGEPEELIPLHPDRVTVEQDSDYELIYRVQQKSGSQAVLLADEMFHLRGLSSDGVNGLSTLAHARNSLGFTLATEEYGARSFAQGVRPSGVLRTDSNVSENAFKRLRESWAQAYAGLQNTAKTLILEEGLEWQAIGMTSEDAQFLESRRFQVGEVARWFRVPPHMIADLERATFSNIEEQGLEFVIYSLMPRLRRWEEAIQRTLIQDDRYYAEHTVDGLLRGNVEARWRAYATALAWGCMSPDEVRARENMNPLPDGQGNVYLRPLNMAPLDELGNEDFQAAVTKRLLAFMQDSSVQERAERNGHVGAY